MFHENLRSIRENREISQQQMAELIGIPVTTYRNYENTMREPSFDVLIKIAQVLKTSVDELLGIKNNEKKYAALFLKIKRLPEKKLQMLCAFTDFLFTIK